MCTTWTRPHRYTNRFSAGLFWNRPLSADEIGDYFDANGSAWVLRGRTLLGLHPPDFAADFDLAFIGADKKMAPIARAPS